MTQISFYTLPVEGERQRLQFACRLADKAYKLGHSIYIHNETIEQAKVLDDLLWQFRPSSFLPHQLATTEEDTREVRLLIGCQQAPKQYQDVLINLSNQPCELHQQFSRINEIISSDKACIEQGRTSYRFYKQLGYQPETHKL